jgi:hypothetical protein
LAPKSGPIQAIELDALSEQLEQFVEALIQCLVFFLAFNL